MKFIYKLFVILQLIPFSVNAQSDFRNPHLQKKTDLKITIDTAIDINDLYVQIDDGTKLNVLRDSLSKRSFQITIPYFAPYASLSISTSQGQDFEYFLDERTATINILLETGSKDVLKVSHNSTIIDLTDSTQNPLRKVFSEFRKNDPDNLALFDLWTSRAKELKSNDSLRNVYSTLLKSFNKKLFDLYAQHPNDYYTFFCFRRDMDFTISTIKTDEQYFSDMLAFYNRTFPEKYRNTMEGEKLAMGMKGKIAPTKKGNLLDMTLSDINGGKHTTKNFESEYVLLDFWASWCPPCMAQIPDLRELNEKFSKDRLQIIGVSADLNYSKLKDAIAENQMNWTHVWDEGRIIASQLDVSLYPTLILINRKGEIVYRQAGSGNKEKLWEILEVK